MALSWRGRRKALYIGASSVIGLVVLVVLWQVFFTHTPTCFDGIRNGDETGVDCGGSCALLCTAMSRDPVVLWSLPFRTGPSTFTAAAYIRNTNQGAGAKQVPYSFQLFDKNNVLVIEKDGYVNIAPTQTTPIVETNLTVGGRDVARAEFAFGAKPVWEKVSSANYPALSLSGATPNADYSRVSTTVTNNSMIDAHDVTVYVVLFDANGTARAASKSVLAALPRHTSQLVVFTWPQGDPTIVRAELAAIPSF